MHALKYYNPDPNEPVQHLNVGTGQDLTIKNLASLVANTIGFKGAINWDTSMPDGTPKKQLDTSRISETGWKADITLEEGLSTTYANYLASYKSKN